MAEPTSIANANSYFDVNTNYLSSYQKNMYKESCQMFGIDCKYLPVEFVVSDIDYVFGEIPNVYYDNAYNIRLYVDGYDDLHEAVDNYGKFGLFIEPENLKITVGKDDFESIILAGGTSAITAKAGDIIYFIIHDEQLMFEVTHQELLFNSYYNFDVRMFQYDANTAIETGDSDIDNVTTEDKPVTDENQAIEDANSTNTDASEEHSIFGGY